MTPTNINQREQLGQVIATAKRAIKHMNASRYLVKSQSGNGKYVVTANKLGWVCTCPDQKFRGVKCKHIYAVEISYAIRKEVEITKIEPLVNVNECIYCKSVTIVKDGLRHNKHGDIQKFNCKTCNKYFTINIGFEKMKHNPQGITTAKKSVAEFYGRATKSRGIDDTNANLNNTNGFLNAHMDMVYGVIEDLMQAINDINGSVDRFATTRDFQALKKELKSYTEKTVSATAEELERYKKLEEHSTVHWFWPSKRFTSVFY